MKWLCIICFVCLACNLACVAAGIAGTIRGKLMARGKGATLAVILCAVASALLILRPHEDTFTGLDNSCYRLMALAIEAGKPLHYVDNDLLCMPRGIRNDVMLLPTMEERNTRDRSYMVKSLESCEAEPFFYPLLPMCAVGFNAVMPGGVMDYLVPCVGLLFFVLCLCVGAASGGIRGLLLAAALLAGSPLPVWLLRGYYVESVGGILMALSVMSWLLKPLGGRVPLSAFLASGLAVSFHPALVVLAVPSLILFVLTSTERLVRQLACTGLFIVGIAPMILMALYACTPYGSLSLSTIVSNYRDSSSHRITTVIAAFMTGLFIAGFLSRGLWSRLLEKASGSTRRKILWLIMGLSLAPVLYASTLWSQAGLVVRGLLEMCGGIRLGLGFVIAVLLLRISLSRTDTREKLLLAVFLASLPVFVYLKGAEQMGLWSQRRLIAPYLMAVACLLPASSTWLESVVEERKSVLTKWLAGTVVVIFLLSAALANPLRWPAPYGVRYERGAWEWVETIRSVIGDRLVFFDHYPDSVPFAVKPGTHALGLCGKMQESAGPVLEWLASQARDRETLCATAFADPGLEDGVILSSIASFKTNFPTITSDGALPAEKRKEAVSINLLRLVPIDDNVPLPGLFKKFDGGPLAKRGPWGGYISVDVAGSNGMDIVSSQWSRQGSGIIGPVPAPGGRVRFSMDATFARKDENRNRQIMTITPPWGTPAAVSLVVTDGFSVVSVEIARPAESLPRARTGIYRLSAATPYNPAEDGIDGYDSDLGVLIRSIRIEVLQDVRQSSL